MSSRELPEEQRRLQRQAHEVTDEARWLFDDVGLRSGARSRSAAGRRAVSILAAGSRFRLPAAPRKHNSFAY